MINKQSWEDELDQIFGTRGTDQRWQKDRIKELIQQTIDQSVNEAVEEFGKKVEILIDSYVLGPSIKSDYDNGYRDGIEKMRFVFKQTLELLIKKKE